MARKKKSKQVGDGGECSVGVDLLEIKGNVSIVSSKIAASLVGGDVGKLSVE